ncbi:GL15943 [Drosophila persimilis]|uniref:GL15943 n=1 Tax=Drosophila persimilis TaxID=7234 RepID=B4H0U3_DROPE|nr:GL15943 [Drosophila persimilis]
MLVNGEMFAPPWSSEAPGPQVAASYGRELQIEVERTADSDSKIHLSSLRTFMTDRTHKSGFLSPDIVEEKLQLEQVRRVEQPFPPPTTSLHPRSTDDSLDLLVDLLILCLVLRCD